MSDHTDIRERYESGLWLTRISKGAWHEMRQRHRLENEGKSLRDAEIARLELEQRVELRRGDRAYPQVFARQAVFSLEDPIGTDTTLGELVGVS